MTRINPGITTTGFSSSTVDDAKTDISPAQKIEQAQDKSLSTAGKIPKGSAPPALRAFSRAVQSMSVKKNEQSSLQQPAADSLQTAAGAPKKPQSRGMHHPALKNFFNNPVPEGVPENAMLSAGSIASTFGVGAALNNIARVYGSPTVKVAGALFPMPAAMASAYVEQGIRDTFDVNSTEFQQAWHHAISPGAFIGVNYAYALSKLPKFPPNTPAGVAATMTVSAVAAGIGGGLSEVVAQQTKKNASSSAPVASDPGNQPTAFEHGLGRTVTQIPAVSLNKVIAVSATGAGGAIPKGLLLGVPAAIGIPFISRNEAASRIADKTKRQPSDQASNTDASGISGN